MLRSRHAAARMGIQPSRELPSKAFHPQTAIQGDDPPRDKPARPREQAPRRCASSCCDYVAVASCLLHPAKQHARLWCHHVLSDSSTVKTRNASSAAMLNCVRPNVRRPRQLRHRPSDTGQRTRWDTEGGLLGVMLRWTKQMLSHVMGYSNKYRGEATWRRADLQPRPRGARGDCASAATRQTSSTHSFVCALICLFLNVLFSQLLIYLFIYLFI